MGVNIDYDIDALKEGIKRFKENIQLFEDEIEKLRAKIKDYYGMIEELEQKKMRQRAKIYADDP